MYLKFNIITNKTVLRSYLCCVLQGLTQQTELVELVLHYSITLLNCMYSCLCKKMYTTTTDYIMAIQW